ncbi:MAG: 50S ribosomal protein L5 [Patescibacteria group bacterium]
MTTEAKHKDHKEKGFMLPDELLRRIDKIVVNVGFGRLATAQAHFEDKILPNLIEDVAAITGQRPAPCPAKKSIANFKLREGMTIGLKTTLRGRRMQHFLERLVAIVFPRIKDFQGIALSTVDENGNLTVGIKETIVFPEIMPDVARTGFGLQITIVPKSRMTREAAIGFYRSLSIPLKKA